jgi:hypothetical protein
MLDDNAQLHTLEGVASATIILLVIIYAIDATSLTPLTSTSSNVHIEKELEFIGQDILNYLDYSEPGYGSKLKNDITNWNGSSYTWNGSAYMVPENRNLVLNNSLTSICIQTLNKRGIAHNVELTFIENSSMLPVTKTMIYNGDPSNNAVIVSRKIVLQNTGSKYGTIQRNDDLGKDEDSIITENEIIKDVDPSTNFYNIVEVKIVMWRM